MAGEQTPDPVQVERQAKEMGWVPQDQFRGAADKWVDAPTFVSRGEEVMPLLKANNKRLTGELDQLRGQLTETQGLVRAGQEAIQALKESQTEFTKAAIQRTKAEIRVALREAREANDMDAIGTLEDQLDDIRDTEREIKAKPPAPAPAPPAQSRQDPEFIAWQRDNPWFGQPNAEDARRTAYMIAEGQALRLDPANAGLKGRAFYEKASANVDAILNPRPGSKVESGSGSGSEPPSRGGPGKKTYRDLPSDARAVCDRQQVLLVGPGRAFKTAAEWQQNYADQYFQE